MEAVSGWRLAIDFGTSNTAAAVQIGAGAPRPVRLSEQADQMLSGVLAGANGLIVGVEAQRSARIDPAAYEPNPKRRVGEGEILLDGREVAVTDALAAVLRHVAGRAGRIAGGSRPSEVLLTYPEHWQEPRRRVLLAAARAAGLAEQPRLVSEPVAAASHYATQQAVPPGAVVAVFDFGGGTCDVAVLRAGAAQGAPFTVLATDGIDPLGGEDLDDLLAQWARAQLRDSGQAELADALDDPALLADRLTFRDQVRAAKQALTDYEQTRIPVAAGGRQAVVTITADEFDRLVAAKIDTAVDLARRTLDRAGVTGPQLHALYLSGGSSHLRLVQRRLFELIGRPPATLEDPKLVVALGALAAPALTGAPASVPPPPVIQPPVSGPPVFHQPISGLPMPPPSTPPGPYPPSGPPPGPPQQPQTAGHGTRSARWPLAVGAVALSLLLLCGGIAVAVAVSRSGDDRGSGTASGPTPGPGTGGPAGPSGLSSATSAPPAGGGSPAAPPAGDCAAALPAAACTLALRLPPDFTAVETCVDEDTKSPGEVTIVRCATPAAAQVGANPGYEIWATQFATPTAMASALEVTINNQGLSQVRVGCDAGQAYGKGPWVLTAARTVTQGQLLCYPSEGYGKLIWTYERDSILMVATARKTDIPALVSWWSDANRSARLN